MDKSLQVPIRVWGRNALRARLTGIRTEEMQCTGDYCKQAGLAWQRCANRGSTSPAMRGRGGRECLGLMWTYNLVSCSVCVARAFDWLSGAWMVEATGG